MALLEEKILNFLSVFCLGFGEKTSPTSEIKMQMDFCVVFTFALLANLVLQIKKSRNPFDFISGFGSYIYFRSASAIDGNGYNREKLFRFPHRILRNDSSVFCGRVHEQQRCR